MSSVAGPRDASDLDHCLLVVLDLKIPGPRYRTDSDLELSVSHGERSVSWEAGRRDASDLDNDDVLDLRISGP